jgi:hypothetical protein
MGGVVKAVGSIFKKPKKVKQPVPLPVPTRNAAAAAAGEEDALRRRRGARANDLTGGSAEASSPGGKTLLGQ